jgi:hypothetical protein
MFTTMKNELDAVTVLTVSRQFLATKSFYREPDGSIAKLPTKMAKRFRASSRSFETIFDLADILTDLNSDPRSFVIRGEAMPGMDLSQPVRRLKYSGPDQSATFRSCEAGRRWVCFDFDKVACPSSIDARSSPGAAINYLASLLPSEFHDVTFWAQWSSSAGIKGWSNLSAHLWFVLDEPITDDDLWLWGQSVAAPIDTRLFNTVQPHFTAAPLFAYDVPDPRPSRHQLIKGRSDVATIRPTQADDLRRTEGGARKTGTHPTGARNTPWTPRPATGSHHPEVGSGRVYQRAGSDSGTVPPETQPLLSDRLIMQFRQRFN